MIELAAADSGANVQALEEQQARGQITLESAVPDPPSIAGRIRQAFRHPHSANGLGSSRDMRGRESPSIGR